MDHLSLVNTEEELQIASGVNLERLLWVGSYTS